MECYCAVHTSLTLIDNVHRDPLAAALGNGFDNGPDFFGDSSLPTDDLPHILGGDVELQLDPLFALGLVTRTASGWSTRFFATYSKSSFIANAPSAILQHAGLLQQAADCVGGLGAVLDPGLGLLAVHRDGSGLGQGL